MVSVTMFAVLEYFVFKSDAWSTLINTAGRQRMLSQQITKAAEQGDAQTISQALEQFERAHAKLTTQHDEPGLERAFDEETRSLYTRLQPAYEGLVQWARTASTLSPRDSAYPAAVEQVRHYETRFLPQMSAIVDRFEATAKADSQQLKILHFIAVAVLLSILAAEAIFVFEPFAKRLREQWTRVRESEDRFDVAVRGSRDAIWDWDLHNHRMYFSPRWVEMFQDHRLREADSSEAWFRLVASSDLEKLLDQFEDLKNERIDEIDLEIEMRTLDGTSIIALCRAAPVRDASGQIVRIAGSLADITSHYEARERLREMAERDGLTGLANRNYFIDRVELAVARRNHDPAPPYAVVYLDLDGFKSINDALGHATGDRLLECIAARLESVVPDPATIARLGGDEFAILVPDEDPDALLKLCDRIVERCASPHTLGQHEIVCTSSIGVVIGSAQYTTADEVIRDADVAMYNAKAAGKCQARFFDQAMHTSAIRRLTLENRLREARFDRDFDLKMQPIVSLESGKPAGFEMLIRWVGPGLENVGPDMFIPIAEETGLIVRLGEWILEESIRVLKSFDAQLGHTETVLHVNVSRKQVMHDSFVPFLESILAQDPALRGRLILEITETAVMDRHENLIPRMQELRQIGFPLAMDDFGTGHSSLSCLHQFPLDELKIDRSFILNIEHNREFTAIYQAIVSLADNLGLKVVAEGMETEGQLAQLQAMGCAFAQGYLFERPLSQQEALAYMKGGQSVRNAA